MLSANYANGYKSFRLTVKRKTNDNELTPGAYFRLRRKVDVAFGKLSTGRIEATHSQPPRRRLTKMADTKEQTGVQGGTHEQHVAAGSQSHKNHPAADRHHEAASRHETAANSHRQAAQSHEDGQEDNARAHATNAHGHSTRAHDSSTNAHGASHGTQGGSHEQHVRAGEQSGGNRGNSEQHAEAGRKGGQH